MSTVYEQPHVITVDESIAYLDTELDWLNTQIEYCEHWLRPGSPYFTMIQSSLISMHSALTSMASAVSIGVRHLPWRANYDTHHTEYLAAKRLFEAIIEGVA